MDLLQALILGVIEGITEYLPVSSTGHLLIAQRLMGIEGGEIANGYAIAIQAGAIVAVLGLYRKHVFDILAGLVGRNPAGLRLGIAIVIAFLPAAVIGGLFDSKIEEVLFGVWPIIIAWVVGGVFILLAARWVARHREGRDLHAIDYRGALLVGFIQCIAMWPGTSRSLVTILGGLAVGLSMSAAVEFAFLLGLITLGAATTYKSIKLGPGMVEAYGWPVLLAGFAAAWVSAAIAVKWMVAWLNKHGLTLFAWWRFAAAIAAFVLLL